jgi:2-methylisocitrate lyase-like PEP mutase family enzyme
MTQPLLARLQQKRLLLAPGVYDALTALLAEQAGFEALYLSGASIAYTRLGRSDIGLVTASEVADTLTNIRERVSLPVIVDADTGFGNALNTIRTVKMFERAGASAIQLEDQLAPKRCGHLDGKTLVSTSEMTGKLRAALDTRKDALIVARTDAVAVGGFEAALARARLYREAGADVLFVEAPREKDQLARIAQALGNQAPLLANMVEGGKTPPMSAPELQSLGFALVIFPGAIARVLAKAASEFYASLAAHGTSEPWRTRMLDFDALNELIGTPEMLALGERYSGEPAPRRGADRKR